MAPSRLPRRARREERRHKPAAPEGRAGVDALLRANPVYLRLHARRITAAEIRCRHGAHDGEVGGCGATGSASLRSWMTVRFEFVVDLVLRCWGA